MRHDTQQHEEDGHGHYDDIVTNTATQKKHFNIFVLSVYLHICNDRSKPKVSLCFTWLTRWKLRQEVQYS